MAEYENDRAARQMRALLSRARVKAQEPDEGAQRGQETNRDAEVVEAIGRPTHSSEKRPDQKDRCKNHDHRADEPQGCAVGGDTGAIQRQVSPEEVYDANGLEHGEKCNRPAP